MKITEDNFIEQLKKRNEDALIYVISNYGSYMKYAVNRILYLYPQDAEECLYDSIFKVWENINSFDQSKNSFKNWSIAVAKYTALNRLKKISGAQTTIDIDDIQIAEDTKLTDNELFNESFRDLISCLSEEDKSLFIRLFWNGESVEEVSKSTGTKKSNIYNRLSRSKKKIIRCNPGFFMNKE